MAKPVYDHQVSVPETPLKLGGAPGIVCLMLRAGEGSEVLVSNPILPFLPTYDIAASAYSDTNTTDKRQ